MTGHGRVAPARMGVLVGFDKQVSSVENSAIKDKFSTDPGIQASLQAYKEEHLRLALLAEKATEENELIRQENDALLAKLIQIEKEVDSFSDDGCCAKSTRSVSPTEVKLLLSQSQERFNRKVDKMSTELLTLELNMKEIEASRVEWMEKATRLQMELRVSQQKNQDRVEWMAKAARLQTKVNVEQERNHQLTRAYQEKEAAFMDFLNETNNMGRFCIANRPKTSASAKKETIAVENTRIERITWKDEYESSTVGHMNGAVSTSSPLHTQGRKSSRAVVGRFLHTIGSSVSQHRSPHKKNIDGCQKFEGRPSSSGSSVHKGSAARHSQQSAVAA